jgi:dihydrodipicolinate synthase/N-acetylneuraminate lyase
MPDRQPNRMPMTAVPRGLIHVPVTPFTPDNEIDLATFGRVCDFLLRHNAAALCVNLHLGESLNLTLDERKRLAACAVEVANGRVPVIVHGRNISSSVARRGRCGRISACSSAPNG